MRRVALSPSWPSLEASFYPATMLLGMGGLANAWDALRSAVMSSDAGGPAHAWNTQCSVTASLGTSGLANAWDSQCPVTMSPDMDGLASAWDYQKVGLEMTMPFMRRVALSPSWPSPEASFNAATSNEQRIDGQAWQYHLWRDADTKLSTCSGDINLIWFQIAICFHRTTVDSQARRKDPLITGVF